MGRARIITALGSLLVVLAAASLFAIASGCGTMRRAAGARRRRLVLASALVAAVAAAWTLLSPLVAMAVPLAFAAAFAARGAWRADDLSEYVAASDRARSDEPPWWPEFEYEFRRQCRRYERARGGQPSRDGDIHALETRCEHSGCALIGHGHEAGGAMYCCAHCARKQGHEELADRTGA